MRSTPKPGRFLSTFGVVELYPALKPGAIAENRTTARHSEFGINLRARQKQTRAACPRASVRVRAGELHSIYPREATANTSNTSR